MGIEPTNVGTTIRCVNHFATIAIICLDGGGGQIRTAEPEGADLQSAAFSHFATPPKYFRDYSIMFNGGPDGTRTRDLLRDRQAF